MARIARESQFTHSEIAIVHVVTRVVRRVFLMGEDRFSGKNYDYRKVWIEQRIEQLAAFFGIDLLCFSILSNHVHLVLRQRPDMVQSWSDDEVARRWLMLCPHSRNPDGSPCEPTEPELNSIRDDESRLKEIRSRLSDISWWMRLMCQTIARRINCEDQSQGHVWQARFRAVLLLDEAALLACAAYVDLNPIRAAMAETLEQSDHTSVQRRIQALKQRIEADCLGSQAALQKTSDSGTESGTDETSTAQQHNKPANEQPANKSEQPVKLKDATGAIRTPLADRILAPIHLDELLDAAQVQPSATGYRCSDRGFLSLTLEQYLELLDWTARSLAGGKPGATPKEAPPIWQRLNLGISAESWLELVANFGKLFSLVAGKPQVVDRHRGVKRPKRFKLGRQARELLSA